MHNTEQFLTVAERPSLPETVYIKLREAIHNGAFKPGELLRQEELARKFGISRAPLREALPRLEADGIIVLRPRRGYAVVELDPIEIQDIFDLRLTLEEKAVREAVARRNPADIARVRDLLRQMKELRPATADERRQWSDLNTQFHEAITSAAGRKHLTRMVSNLRSLVEPYIRYDVNMAGDVSNADREHELLVDAYATGDVETAARLIHEHIQSTADRLMGRSGGKF